MSLRTLLVLAACSLSSAIQIAGSAQRMQLQRAAPQMGIQEQQQNVASKLVAASVAMLLTAGNPIFTPAVELPVVQQSGANMVAVADDDLSDAQKQFLEERKKLKQVYDEPETVEGNYKSAEEVKDKKSVYTLIIGGLIAIAFIAPMLQYFYYTMGE